MPPLARAPAHPRIVSILISPPPTLRPCRHQHISSNRSGQKHDFSSYRCKISHKSPTHAPSPPCNASFFHSTCRREAANASEMKQKNHYERLGIHTDATPGEIKKSFYALSKVHHPDANPNDPTASESFSLLSEAYTILSDPSRRAAYDRDTLRLHASSSSSAHHARHGSYHSSSSSAGGRAPSGLSKRRGTFRGPPPSFYRSGGWGAHSEKRRAAHEGSTSGGAESAASSSQHGGMGPGSDPFGHRDDDVPHFDRRQHKKTHEYQDERRSQRGQKRSAREKGAQSEMQEAGMGAHFLIVSGVLGAALLAPMVYYQFANVGRKRRDR